MTTRTVESALRAARRESLKPTTDWTGLCLKFARSMWGVPALHRNAITAWNECPPEHRHSGTAPAGALIVWDIGQHGHVAVALGHGVCWTTDLVRRGKVDCVASTLVTVRWGGRRLGWMSQVNGVDLPL